MCLVIFVQGTKRQRESVENLATSFFHFSENILLLAVFSSTVKTFSIWYIVHQVLSNLLKFTDIHMFILYPLALNVI